MNDESPTVGSETQGTDHPTIAIIDGGVIDPLFAQLGAHSAQILVEQCFAEFDSHMQWLHLAVSRQEWGECLTAIHGLRGIAVDCGAMALSEQITFAKSALLARDYSLLASVLTDFVEVQRDTRSALMVRLAKCTATELCHADPNWPAL